MERVDHVHIVQVGRGGLVGQIHRVLEGNVPDGEGLELGVTGLHAALVLVVQLGKAGRHFAAAGAGGRDDHQRALSLDVIVLAVALVADDAGHIVGVAGNFVVAEGADAQTVQPLFKGLHLRCGGVLGHAHAAHIQAHLLKRVDQAQHVQIVGDAVVAADLVADDVLGADNDDHLGLILQLKQHLQFGIGLKTRQHAGCMVIIEQLAAEFQIELVVELLDALTDVLRLHRKIFIVVKSNFHRSFPFPLCCARHTAPELFHNRNSIPHSKTGCNPKGGPCGFFQQMRRFALFFALFFVKMVLAAFLTTGV